MGFHPLNTKFGVFLNPHLEVDMWKCLSCGKENRDNRNHCWHCSTPQGDTLSELAKPPKTQHLKVETAERGKQEGSSDLPKPTAHPISQSIENQIKTAHGDYLVIPFIGKIKSGLFSSENAETVSRQLQSLINQYSQQGWEFHNIAKVDIEVNPGCLASLFGAKTSYVTFDQVVFRRARP